MTSQTRKCQNCKKDFVIEPDDFGFYEKIKVPPPTFCWLCRAQRRFTFRNERLLYKRESDATGEMIFSMYSPDSGTKIYENDYWYSDKWDARDYGKEVDFNRPFLEQVGELIKEVPLIARSVVKSVNCDYINNAGYSKNSYLVFNGQSAEDTMYSNGINFAKWCMDVSHVSECENCYQCFWITKCTNCFFSSHCENSFNLWFSKDCNGCSDCFGCVNLRNKKYHIFNKPYSKEEYEKKIKEFNLHSYKSVSKLWEKAMDFWLQFPIKFYIGTHNENITGNYVSHSKNVSYGHLVRNSENMKYCQFVQEDPGSKDCYDYSIFGAGNELSYECHSCGLGSSNVHFCAMVYIDVKDIEYSYQCISSSDLFGCVSVRKKQYCILNKQYIKEEYFDLREKVIQHMNDMPYVDSQGIEYKYGEFFPPEISPFGYNEGLSQEYFPLSREEALEKGYRWSEQVAKDHKPTISADDLPDSINDVDDSILKEAIGCEHKGKCQHLCTVAFRITPNELTYYRKYNLPLPRICPSCRTFERLSQRTKLELFRRKCQCAGEASDGGEYKNAVDRHEPHEMKEHCPNEFETAYSPDKKEIVYCEQCYNAEVV